MIQVINGEIKQYSLPKTGTLSDGRTVSGYHLLDADILKAEGWLPLVDEPPGYDPETEYLVHDGYDIQADKEVRLYRVEPIPEPEPVPDLHEQVQELQAIIDALLGEGEPYDE